MFQISDPSSMHGKETPVENFVPFSGVAHTSFSTRTHLLYYLLIFIWSILICHFIISRRITNHGIASTCPPPPSRSESAHHLSLFLHDPNQPPPPSSIVGAAVAPAKAASLDEVVRLQANSARMAACNVDIVVQ
jgi:hypothetical protein